MPFVRQTIADTDRKLVLKSVNYGNTESGLVLVNAAALAYALQTMTTTLSTNNFVVGENVSAASGGTAKVQDVINSTSVILSDVAGTWTPGTTVTGLTSAKTRAQSGALAPASYLLQLSRIVFTIGGADNTAKVQLEWQGTGGGANNALIAVLSGQGTWELDTHAMRVPNNATSPTGSVLITTGTGWDANCNYTLVCDFAKVQGYSGPNLDRNTQGF